ncbi:conserved hypothetical protein [Echinococcus multilocularis]|uniref:Uncharacterized protein n=1 Tax=Echinococcus multilocularis TaxID=6211 RepID=A0A087VX75_ECHMU|nr:conserved hypothetical protein [Echinococcus multilocularis]
MRKLVTFTRIKVNQYVTATETSNSVFEESNGKDNGRFEESKTVEKGNKSLLVGAIAMINGKATRVGPNSTYNGTGEGIGMGDINAVLKSVKTRSTKLASRSHLKALKKIRLILEDLTKALFKRVAIWSCKQLTQWKTCLNAPQNITEYLKSSGQNRGDWKISYFIVNVPLHAEIVQCINEGLLSNNDSDGELSNPDSKSMLHYSVAKRDGGHSSTAVSKTSKQITNTRVIANVQSYGKNQHGAVDEVEINHSNSSRCGCNRSFTGVSHVQGPSSGRSDNCGTWGQMCSDPDRMANSGEGCSSGGQNATKCPSSCPIKSVNDISKETDINKIAASCIRRYTLEESKALATSPHMYRPNPCSPTQKSCDNMKPTASCPGEQMSTTSKMPGKKVEGQAELSLKPLSSPKCGQNYPRMRQNESVMADSSDGQYRRGLQSSSMCRPPKPQNDKCMRNSTDSLDDFKSFCNPGYSQPRPPTNMQRNPANRKSGRHSPCRIAITGCERPVLPSYCPPRISNPEIDSRDRFSRGRTDYGVCGDMGKSTSRFLNTGEDGECGGSSQRLTGGEKMNRDCCQQSSRYPTSPSPKWNNTTAKDVSCDCLKGNRPHDLRNEDQELRYGDDSCQKNPGGYFFKIKYTEVEEADSPSTPDASDDDCLGKPNQLQARDRNHHSPNECSCKSPCKTPSNPQYASCKYSVEDYSRDDDEVGYQGCENFDGDTRVCPDDYYGNDSSVPPFLQNESSCGRIRASKHTYEDPSALMMQRCQQNYMSYSPDFVDFSRSPHQPQQRYMEENRGCMHQMWSDMERSPNWQRNKKNSERARYMSRAHSEECPSPYPVCKKTCGIRRKRSRKRCVSRRQPAQKCSGRPRKVVKLSRRASMELERRYAAQVPRSESSLACEAARNKRRYSPPDSCREDAIMSGENKKCLCRSSSRCVMVNPCYRNNRAALLRRKFNAAKIEEEGDPCCCITLFRSTPVQGNDFSPGQFSESCEEREGGAFNYCMNGEQVERDPYREAKSPCSRSPIPLNGCQPRERDPEAKKNSCRSNTPCLNIDLKGKKIMLRKFENTTNCASSELTLPENMCGKNSANNDISIALGDKTIIIKNPGSTDQVCFESKYGQWAPDSCSQSGSSCVDSVVSRHMGCTKQHRQKSPCKRKCGSAAVRKRSTPLKTCSLRETSTCERSAGIKPSVCQPSVCVALDFVPDVQEPPPKEPLNKLCTPTKSIQTKKSPGFCPCTQISNGAMPCSKRPAKINSPTASSPQSGSLRTTPIRQWNTPPTCQPGSVGNSNSKSKSSGGYNGTPCYQPYRATAQNASADGGQRGGCKPSGCSKVSGASGEPSKKTAPTQTTKEEESKEGDEKENCTQCAKRRSFFARMCDKFKKKCAKANAQNQTDEEVKDDDSDDTDTGDGSKCMPVNDTTSCSLRFNETRSYNCSACSTSRCVSNQSHSFMDFTDDPTTNLQLTMRSWNNTASEPHSGFPAFVQHPLINSRGWCKSERVYRKTGRPQCREDYRMRTCPTGMWQNNLCASSHSFAPDMSVKCCSVASKALVTKCLCQEVNLGVPSCKNPTMRIRKERNFKLNGVCFCSKYGYPNKGYYFPLLAFGHSIKDNSDQVKGPKRLRNYHRFAQCPCYRSYIGQFPCHGGKVSLERGDRDYEKEDRMKAIEKSKNSNNFPSGTNEFDCCAKSMGNGGPTTEGRKTASSQCFTRDSSSHFLHEPTIKPPHQGSASTKNTCDDLKRLDRPLFQTINRPCYEVLALFKRPLAKNHTNESMMHEPQKSKYLDSHYQPALRKVRTDPSTVKSKNVNTSSRWPRISTPYKKGSHTLRSGRTIENLGEVDNRRFSATKSTDEFTCGRVESALLSPSNKTCGYVEVRPICKQPVVIKSSVKSNSGLDVPFYAKNWSQSMPKFQPSPVRSSSFMMLHGNTLSAKPAFLPRNSAPSLQTRRSYGQVPPPICSKASFNNMYPHRCRVSFDSKPVNPPYGSMGCGNYPRGANYPTGFSKMSERIMPPVSCQQAYSFEIAKMHNGPTEVNKLKSAVAPKGKDQVLKPWQGSEKASAIKVPEASLTPRVMNASSLRSSSNSFGFPTPHENANVQSIKAVIQAPKMPKYTFARCQNDTLLPNSRITVISPSLHHKATIMTNGYEPNENTEFEPLTPMGQKKGEKIPFQYSFQVEGRRIHVKVDKEGVFHVQEVGKPPSPPPSVNVVKSGEKSRPNTNGVNGERSTSLGSSIKATAKAGEIQSQTSSSAQLESESSGKSIGVNGTPNKCSTSRSKNSPIHEILRRSIRSLSGKLTPRFSCQANQQMGNSHTVIEEEKMSGSDCELWVPLTASEIPFQTDSKRITSKIFSTNCPLKMHNTSKESMIPCNQNDHQAILDHCRGTHRRDSTTSSQMLFRGVSTAVGSSYTDALPIVSSTKSHRSKKKKRVYANAESENVNKPVSYTHYSNYKSGDCAKMRGSWADERDCIVEDFDSYPKTKNSTLFTYDCQSDSETSIGISASMNMGKQLRLQAGYIDSAKPATPYHHFSLLGFSGGEEDSTRPHVEKQHAPIVRSNSAPLFLRKKTSSNHLYSNQGTPEPALSNSDTDNIMESPLNEDYCDLQEGTEAQAQADLTNRNNSAREESRITARKVSNRQIYSEEFLQQCSNFSNQNNYFKSYHEQVTHPQLTTLRSPRLLPPLNDSLVCGDVKKIVSVGSQLSNEKENNVTMFPVEIDKDDTSPRNDGNSTEPVKEKSSDSETEDPSPMSTTLTLLLEGLCGTGGGAMDSRVSNRSEPQRFNTKCKKRPCVNENAWCASKPTTNGQNKGEGKKVETSAHNCLKFKENKSFLLRKRQNCNHTSVRCMACLKKQQKQTLAKPEIHFFAKGILKHPFRKARRKDKRSPKDTIFKKSSKGSPRSETKKRRRGHLTKPSGDRCCCASLSRRWKSSSRHKTRSHTSSCCNRMASFGIDTDGYGPNTSTECYTFQLVEPSASIEQPSPDFSRCKYDPLMHQGRLFRQCSDVSVAPRSASLSQYSRRHFVSASSPKSRSVSMPTAEENEYAGEVENSTKLGKPNFIFPPPYDTSRAPGKLSLNSSSKTGECQSLMGDCMANRQSSCLKMKTSLPIWDVKASTPPLLMVPSSRSQSDESSFVSSPITSLNTSEAEV